MAKCYTQEFCTCPVNPWPRRPIQFNSIKDARQAYYEFAQDCDKFGYGKPAVCDLWLGEICEVEEVSGVYCYPEFPYKRFSIGTMGGVVEESW